MKYFNTFKLKNQILFQRPSFEEVYEMIINNEKKTIINESVFKFELFEELFNYLKTTSTITCFTTEKLLDFFPINCKIFKILRKNKNQNLNKLYIIKEQYSSKNTIKKLLKKICKDEFIISNDLIDDIFNDLKDCNAYFTGLSERKDFGILWLYENKFNIVDLQHEFIHYLEWFDKEYASNFNIKNLNLDELTNFQIMFEISNNDLDYILDKHEYQVLINEFLNELTILKNNYYNQLTNYKFARHICFNLLRDNHESVDAYLNKIKSFKYFNELFSSESFGFEMIVAYNCLDYKIMNIKNHIFGKFKK